MRRLGLTIIAGLLLGTILAAQGSLSTQVLQLLTRVNAWTQTNTFSDLRVAAGSIPSDTTRRLYVDNSNNLYFNGGLIAGAGGGVTPHNLLSTTHADTLAGAVVRGALVVGNTTPAWSRLLIGASGTMLRSDGTDASWSTNGSGLTSLTAANLTGTAAAIDGNAITNLNASNLGTGTVPLARLTGITNTQIAAGAGIVYSKLTLTGSIVNADLTAGTLTNAAINAAAAIAYSKLSLTASIVFADWASNSCTNLQVPQYNGTSWVCKSLSTSDISGAGTVTSVALTAPSILSVAGSPITTTGTLALSLATQTANTVWAGPTSGGAAGPTFRALVNADLPLSGVAAATYASVTVNTAGVVTAATATMNLATQATGTLARANGGTGVTVSADDSVLVGSGTAWVAATLPDCTTGALEYTQATNLFSCAATGGPTHNLLSATHSDTLAGSVARGDLVTGNSTPKWTRLAIGTAGQLLTTNGTDPSWSDTLARGTITTSSPWTQTQTWNAGGVTFRGVDLTITDTASAAASTAFRIQGGAAGATALFAVDKTGMTSAVVYQTTTALVALGGGAGATLGTIGGSGPASAGQNTWLLMKDSTGASFWVPAWK